MGVGVYSNDFGSAGTTFLVSGPLATDEEYDAYCREAEDPLDRTEWATEQWDDFTQDMSDTIGGALRELGFFRHDDRRGYVRASFDNDFVSAAYNGIAEIGWRSWEHDLVIGISGDGRWQRTMADPGAHVEDFAAEQGMDPEKAKDSFMELVNAVDEYTRISLQEAGFECRYRTSGYTTAEYAKPENSVNRLQELATLITERVQFLAMRFDERVPRMDRVQRVAFAKMVDEDRVGLSLEVPFVDFRDGSIGFVDSAGGILFGRQELTGELAAHLASLQDGNVVVPLPVNEHTEAVYRVLRADRAGYGNILLSLEELEEALEDNFAPRCEEVDGTVRIAFESAPAPAPGL